jgi:hypothetical protein
MLESLSLGFVTMPRIPPIRPPIRPNPAVDPYRVKPPRLVPVERRIDFDVTPAGGALADGTSLDGPSPYEAYGIRFTARGAAAGGQVCVKSTAVPAQSGRNVVALRLPATHPRGPILIEDVSEAFGIVRVDIQPSARWVAIQAAVILPWASYLTDPNAYSGFTPYLKAYSDTGALIGSAQMPVSALPPLSNAAACSSFVQLRVQTGEPSIHHVEFSCRQMAAGMDCLKAVFDTLTFEVIDLVRP